MLILRYAPHVLFTMICIFISSCDFIGLNNDPCAGDIEDIVNWRLKIAKTSVEYDKLIKLEKVNIVYGRDNKYGTYEMNVSCTYKVLRTCYHDPTEMILIMSYVPYLLDKSRYCLFGKCKKHETGDLITVSGFQRFIETNNGWRATCISQSFFDNFYNGNTNAFDIPRHYN